MFGMSQNRVKMLIGILAISNARPTTDHVKFIVQLFIRKDCFQNKSKFITEDHFTKHMNITIHQLNINEIIYKR